MQTKIQTETLDNIKASLSIVDEIHLCAEGQRKTMHHVGLVYTTKAKGALLGLCCCSIIA